MADAMQGEIARILRELEYGDDHARLLAVAITGLWRAAWREAIRRIGNGEAVERVRAWQEKWLARGFDAIERAFAAPARRARAPRRA